MSMRTPLGRVRGLGSAKEGVGHWWAQRVTAVALVPLTLWFVASLVSLAGASHGEVTAWIASPLVSGLLISLIIALFYHTSLGLQVIIEDYVHHEPTKLVMLLCMQGGCFLLAVVGVLAVLSIFLGN